MLIDMVRSGEVDPVGILTQHEPLGSGLDAYKACDERQEGWIKVKRDLVSYWSAKGSLREGQRTGADPLCPIHGP
jgi:hypothetical protein